MDRKLLHALQSDPDETEILALDPEKNSEAILRMNALLAKEVGANDGGFLPDPVRPRKPVVMN